MDHPHCEFDLQITPKAAKKCANSGNSALAWTEQIKRREKIRRIYKSFM